VPLAVPASPADSPREERRRRFRIFRGVLRRLFARGFLQRRSRATRLSASIRDSGFSFVAEGSAIPVGTATAVGAAVAAGIAAFAAPPPGVPLRSGAISET